MPDKGMVLEFLPNVGDEDEGLSDAGIETFRDSPYASVARECGQNSRDAALKLPVVLRFDAHVIDTASIPDLEAFRATIAACKRHAHARRDDKQTDFFDRATKLLASPKTEILVIADEGTRGLTGPCEPGKAFHTLVKGAGVSTNKTDTSGGSFGIGKKAAFAISSLHTNFYSTIYHDGGDHPKFLAMGKCTLVSHEDGNHRKLRPTGYWGAGQFQPVESQDAVPGWLRRTTRGTSVVALGFTHSDNWSWRIAESLLRNFFAAIHGDEMVCEIDDGKIRIDSKTLPQLFADRHITDAANDNDSVEDLKFSQQLLECLTSRETQTVENKFLGIGSMRLRVLVHDRFPKRICILRNGMYITDGLKNFNDKLIRFPLCRDFVAILECADDESNRLFRSLENPKHDELSPERLFSNDEKTRVRQAMHDLIQWIREEIKSRTFNAPEDVVQLEELNEFFSDISDESPIPDPASPENNPNKLVYTPVSKRKTPRVGQGTGTRGGAGGTGTGKGSGGSGRGSHPGAGTGGTGGRGTAQVPFSDFRNTLDRDSPSRRRILYITPGITGKARIRVEGVGMNDNQRLRVASVNGAPASSDSPLISLQGGQRNRFMVEFAEDFSGPLEITLTSDDGD